MEASFTDGFQSDMTGVFVEYFVVCARVFECFYF